MEAEHQSHGFVFAFNQTEQHDKKKRQKSRKHCTLYTVHAHTHMLNEKRMAIARINPVSLTHSTGFHLDTLIFDIATSSDMLVIMLCGRCEIERSEDEKNAQYMVHPYRSMYIERSVFVWRERTDVHQTIYEIITFERDKSMSNYAFTHDQQFSFSFTPNAMLG